MQILGEGLVMKLRILNGCAKGGIRHAIATAVLRTINAVRGRRVETDYQEDVHDFLMHPRKGIKRILGDCYACKLGLCRF